MKPETRYGLEVRAEYMKNLGILKLIVVNNNRTSMFLEQVRIHYSNPLMYVFILIVIIIVLAVASMLQDTEGIIMFINSMLTLSAIIIGVIGRKIGTKVKNLNVRVVLGPGEPYSLTIPLKKKPVTIEVITNKGTYKASVKVPRVKPKVSYRPPSPTGK